MDQQPHRTPARTAEAVSPAEKIDKAYALLSSALKDNYPVTGDQPLETLIHIAQIAAKLYYKGTLRNAATDWEKKVNKEGSDAQDNLS